MFEARQEESSGGTTITAAGGYNREGKVEQTSIVIENPEAQLYPYCIWSETHSTSDYSKLITHIVVATYNGLEGTPEALFTNSIIIEIDLHTVERVAEYDILGPPLLPSPSYVNDALAVDKDGEFVPFLTMKLKDSIAGTMFPAIDERDS